MRCDLYCAGTSPEVAVNKKSHPCATATSTGDAFTDIARRDGCCLPTVRDVDVRVVAREALDRCVEDLCVEDLLVDGFRAVDFFATDFFAVVFFVAE